jgi:hypothetical protein
LLQTTKTLLSVAEQEVALCLLEVCLRVVAVQTQADAEFVDGLLEVADAGVAHPSQIEVLGQVLLCLLYATIDISMRLLPILEEQMDDSPVV